jgi:cell division protein FtsW
LQPDTGSAVIIIAAVGSIYLVAGGRWQHILVMMLAGIILLSALAFTRPYIKDRLTTFINPTSDPLGAGYQTQQSLIAVGSGKLFGRGPGQSIQKFNYLPEPISDSIFAVYAEEFGFLGSLLLVILYAVIALTGLRIALYLRSGFERLLVVGLVSMIIIQSVLNMGAMVGLFPLSGMPLIFVSHGGSALMFSLVAVGLVLNASTKLPKSKRIA